jgi:predicted nucleic acid-binding protein
LNIYADTSLLISLYLTDAHTAEAERRIASKPILWLTPLHRAEWAHALEQHIFRKQLSVREARQLDADFESDRAAGVYAETGLSETTFDLCIQLARRHAARFGNRTLDSLHVAQALELQAERFWTFDERQSRLARAEGLKTG